MDSAEPLRRTLAWDRGTEMAEHMRLTVDRGFPGTSAIHAILGTGHQREHQRPPHQHFPKGTDFSVHDQATLDVVALELTGRLDRSSTA